MPTIKNSGYFNSPAFAQAASNLSALFEPPSGADAAGWATANAKRDEASRLKQFFDYRTDPNFDQQQFDRLGVASGAYEPDKSYYSVDQGNATTQRGQDVTAATSRSNNAADNVRAIEDRQMQEAAAMQRLGVTDATSRSNNTADNERALEVGRIGSLADLYKPIGEGELRPEMPPQIASRFGVEGGLPAVQGNPKPRSETEVQGGLVQQMRDAGLITDEMVTDRYAGDKTPVEAVGTDGKPQFMSPGAAVRTGAQPYVKPDDTKFDNYLAVGPDGQEKRFLGYVGANNQIFDSSTHQPVANVLRKEGTGGGMSFETDGQGGIKLSTGNAAGNTTARTTDLQRQEAEAGRAVSELTSLFGALRTDDVGVAGNLNEVLTNYGAQLIPSLARPDVAGTRAQLNATTLGIARSLVGDERLSDGDRRAAEAVMVDGGLGESLPGARAKLASLIVLSAYRQKYANTVRTGGERLPALNAGMLGKLVDEGAIPPDVAQTYSQNVLSRASQSPGGSIPGVNLGEDLNAVRDEFSLPPSSSAAPRRLRFDENGNQL